MKPNHDIFVLETMDDEIEIKFISQVGVSEHKITECKDWKVWK